MSAPGSPHPYLGRRRDWVRIGLLAVALNALTAGASLLALRELDDALAGDRERIRTTTELLVDEAAALEREREALERQRHERQRDLDATRAARDLALARLDGTRRAHLDAQLLCPAPTPPEP